MIFLHKNDIDFQEYYEINRFIQKQKSISYGYMLNYSVFKLNASSI